jgi:uncharacterized protein YciI
VDQPTELFALFHRRGPAVADGQEVFDHPGISEHFAFLSRRIADGTLVAAGPLQDVSGDGMTILDTGTAEEALRLAEIDDRSVAQGVLSVTVRPWQVVMSPRLLDPSLRTTSSD